MNQFEQNRGFELKCHMALGTLVLAIAVPVVCFAQSITLELAAGVASPGTSVTLPLTLNEAGIGPASLEWTLEYAQADFSLVVVTPGPAATASGKMINCTQITGATKCVLWSMDAAPLGRGVIANINLTASDSTLADSSGVQPVNCLAASIAGDVLPVSGQGGGVTLLHLITADPNPIPVAAGVALGQTMISWNTPDSSSVEVHVGSATGALFANGGSTGSAQTGDWVNNGMVFVLVDQTTHALLGTTAVALAPPTITASPNPIPVAVGDALGQTMITWNAPDSSSVEVHVGSATGPIFTEGGSTGYAQTGDWVSHGLVFVLVDATTHAVQATTTVALEQVPPTITADPNPTPVAIGDALSQTTIFWNAPGSSSVEVHVGSAAGPLFAGGGSSGSATTGNWVSNGMAFVLVDATTRAVLATTTVTQSRP